MNILEHTVVIEKIEEVEEAHRKEIQNNGPEANRCVEYDIELLKSAVNKLPIVLYNLEGSVDVDMNMWLECRNAFEEILFALDLVSSDLGDYRWSVKKGIPQRYKSAHWAQMLA